MKAEKLDPDIDVAANRKKWEEVCSGSGSDIKQLSREELEAENVKLRKQLRQVCEKAISLDNGLTLYERGIPIRQWYKGKASVVLTDAVIGAAFDYNYVARFCADIADAMIAEDEEHAKGAANV